MANVEIIADSASVAKGTEVEVITSETKTSHTLDTTRIAEVSTNSYVLNSGGMYGAGYSGGIPGWLNDAINQGVLSIVDGKIDIYMLEESLRTLIRGLETGVNQNIVEIANDKEALSVLTTSVIARLDANEAAVLNIDGAYINESEAKAFALDVVEANFSTPGSAANAWITSLKLASASETAANTSSLEALTSTITDSETGVEATARAYSELSTEVGFIDGEATGLGLIADVKNLQAQADGVVETFFEDYSPLSGSSIDSSIEPYASWLPIEAEGVPTGISTESRCYVNTLTDIKYQYIAGVWIQLSDEDYLIKQYALRSLHTGDTFVYTKNTLSNEVYCLAEGGNWNGTTCDTEVQEYVASYRFAKGQINVPITDEFGYGWFLISDDVAVEALIAASKAQDTADGKRRIFVDKPTVPYDRGDVWLVDADSLPFVPILSPTIKDGEMLRSDINRASGSTFTPSDWIRATKYSDTSTLVSEYELYVDTNLSYNVKIYSTNGNLFRNGIIFTTLSAEIWKGTEDITTNFTSNKFSWIRTSNNTVSDTVWNMSKQGVGSSINITDVDVFGKAVFTCVINLT